MFTSFAIQKTTTTKNSYKCYCREMTCIHKKNLKIGQERNKVGLGMDLNC